MDMRYDAVIFDLDGTLLDTRQGIAESSNCVLIEEHVEPLPVEAYGQYIGDGVRRLFERVLPSGQRAEEDVQRCIARFREVYHDRWHLGAPYDGVDALLDSLRSIGTRMTVLSNKPDEFVRRCVERFLPEHSFEVILGDRDGMPPKPDPTGALEILTLLDLAPSRVVYLGDTPTDMQTAVAAGVDAIGALWGFRTGEELLAAGADQLIDTPGQLLELGSV